MVQLMREIYLQEFFSFEVVASVLPVQPLFSYSKEDNKTYGLQYMHIRRKFILILRSYDMAYGPLVYC